MNKLIYLEGSLICCGQISIESWYTLFYWTYSIVWCEVKCKVLSLIYDGWILTVYNIRLGLLSTPNIRQNPRSHPFRDYADLPHRKPSWKEKYEEEDLSGPCVECAHACLLLFIIYPGLLKVFESTSLNLMDLLIIYVLVFSMYMSLFLTDLG